MKAGYTVRCPKCGAPPEKPCRTIRSGRVTDTHRARLDAAHRSFLSGTARTLSP